MSSGATDAPSSYGAALQHIGLPTLSIAHVTKEGSLKYPFGSVFWHNDNAAQFERLIRGNPGVEGGRAPHRPIGLRGSDRLCRHDGAG